MSNGESDSQTSTNVLGDDLKPKTKQPDTSLNPNVENTKVLTENFGEFKGLNPYHLKKKLLDDSELFDKTAKKYFISSAGGSQNIKKQFGEDPQALNQQFETFKKNFRKDLRESSYSGETVDQTLINRSVELADDPQRINPDQYLSAVRENSKKYKEMGLIRQDGSFIYEGESGSFGQYLASNDELHRELQKDRYGQFEEELSKHHNKVAGLDDPTMKTKAWVVYDKKGPEGLTDFVNGLQDETINDKFDENNFLAKSRVGDKNLSEYYKEFVVGEVRDTEYGQDIAETAYKYDLDPSMISGLVEQESSFNPKAVSSTGAVGLTQLQPATARQYGLKVPDELVKLDKKRINSTGKERDKWERKLQQATKQMEQDPEQDERYNPQKALQATGQYFSDSKKKFKEDDLAIASYHRGVRGLEGDIESGNWREAMPDSTKNYVKKVNENRAKYSEKSDQGLVFRPEKPRKDITEPIPKDLNRYTVQFYNKDGKTKELKTSIQDYVSKHVPQNVAEEFNEKTFMRDGPLSDEYREVVSSVYQRAVEGNEYDMKDLMNTVYANAEQTGKMQGEKFYQIDYNQLDWPVKQAFDAIRMNPETNQMVKDEGDGTYRLVPNMDSIALKANKKVRDMMYSTETKIQRNDDGTVDFKEVPDKGFFSQIWNASVNGFFGGSNFVMKYAGKPLFQGLNNLTDGDVDWIRNAKEVTEAQAGISLSELSTADKDGWLPNAVEETAPMFWYMASMWGMGGAIKKGIGKSMQLVSRLKAGGDVMRLGKLMDGTSKFARMGEAISQSSNPAMNFYAGGAALEALTPKKDSFYNVVPQMFGQGQDNEVSKFYNASDFWTRKAMDVGGSLMLDLGIDTFIGAGKFAKDNIAKKFFDKNKFRSYEYVPETATNKADEEVLSGTYKMKDSPTFQHEIRTFYNEIANGLAEKPIGNVGESLAKNLSKNENINTLHDAVKRFTDQASPVASDMKGQVREQIESLQKRFGNGRKLTDDQLDELAETQYQRFIDSSAENLHNILKNSDDKNLSTKFAQVLEEQVPTTKEFKVAGEPVKPNQAPRWIDKGKNLVVKGDKVFEVDPKFWTADLANSIRKMDLDETAEEVGERKVREAGIDPEQAEGAELERVPQIKEEANRTIGQPAMIDGKVGYITDYNDEGFIVQTADGKINAKAERGKYDEVIDEVNKIEKQNITDEKVEKQFLKDASEEQKRKYNNLKERVDNKELSDQEFEKALDDLMNLETQISYKRMNDLPTVKINGKDYEVGMHGTTAQSKQSILKGGFRRSNYEQLNYKDSPFAGSVFLSPMSELSWLKGVDDLKVEQNLVSVAYPKNELKTFKSSEEFESWMKQRGLMNEYGGIQDFNQEAIQNLRDEGILGFKLPKNVDTEPEEMVIFNPSDVKVLDENSDRILSSPIKTDLTQQEINDNFVKGLAKDFVRKRQPTSQLVQRRETATSVTQRQLPEYNFTKAESQYFKQINDIENRLQNLRERNLDEAVEGQESTLVKDRIQTLKEQRQQVTDELSQFYRDNPQVQKNRAQEKIKGETAQKINFQTTEKLQTILQDYAKELDRMTKIQSKLPFC